MSAPLGSCLLDRWRPPVVVFALSAAAGSIFALLEVAGVLMLPLLWVMFLLVPLLLLLLLYSHDALPIFTCRMFLTAW